MTHVYKFPIGAKVVYTNGYGVCFGVKTITKHDESGFHRKPYKLRPAYHYEGEDTPWCPTEEDRFVLADEHDIIAQKHGQMNYLQLKHGRESTMAERHALLDTDPFEGEL